MGLFDPVKQQVDGFDIAIGKEISKDMGLKDNQVKFIEAVTARGGLVVWSMPEARDFHRYSFGPLVEVTVKTEPYADALMLTTGYHGFGGVYQDTRSATKPGGVWDQTLAL